MCRHGGAVNLPLALRFAELHADPANTRDRIVATVAKDPMFDGVNRLSGAAYLEAVAALFDEASAHARHAIPGEDMDEGPQADGERVVQAWRQIMSRALKLGAPAAGFLYRTLPDPAAVFAGFEARLGADVSRPLNEAIADADGHAREMFAFLMAYMRSNGPAAGPVMVELLAQESIAEAFLSASLIVGFRTGSDMEVVGAMFESACRQARRVRVTGARLREEARVSHRAGIAAGSERWS